MGRSQLNRAILSRSFAQAFELTVKSTCRKASEPVSVVHRTGVPENVVTRSVRHRSLSIRRTGAFRR